MAALIEQQDVAVVVRPVLLMMGVDGSSKAGAAQNTASSRASLLSSSALPAHWSRSSACSWPL